MNDWPTFYTVLFFLAAGSAICAAIALPFVYRKGMRQIDAACAEVFAARDTDKAQSNVKVLEQYRRHAHIERVRRNRKAQP